MLCLLAWLGTIIRVILDSESDEKVKGYYKNPEATRKLFAGVVLHSGDLAVWHEDGSAQILGRQEGIITGER